MSLVWIHSMAKRYEQFAFLSRPLSFALAFPMAGLCFIVYGLLRMNSKVTGDRGKVTEYEQRFTNDDTVNNSNKNNED